MMNNNSQPRRSPAPKMPAIKMLTPNPHTPYQAATRPALPPAPLLTLERALADGLQPASLRWVPDWNENLARNRRGDIVLRLRRQASNLVTIANKLELLGYGRVAA